MGATLAMAVVWSRGLGGLRGYLRHGGVLNSSWQASVGCRVSKFTKIELFKRSNKLHVPCHCHSRKDL
jgi:hypothetical protein